jgi:hypothetical protein
MVVERIGNRKEGPTPPRGWLSSAVGPASAVHSIVPSSKNMARFFEKLFSGGAGGGKVGLWPKKKNPPYLPVWSVNPDPTTSSTVAPLYPPIFDLPFYNEGEGDELCVSMMWTMLVLQLRKIAASDTRIGPSRSYSYF